MIRINTYKFVASALVGGATLLFLSGCSGKGAAEAASNKGMPASAATTALGGNCSSSKDAAPVAKDILGVVPGMTEAEARQAILCANNLYDIADSRRRHHHHESIEQDYNIPPMPDGTRGARGFAANYTHEGIGDTVNVTFVGLPGEERVAGVARSVGYPAGQKGNYDEIKQSLIKKYGEPSYVNDRHYTNSVFMSWAFRPDGARMTEADPAFKYCADVGNFSPAGTVPILEPKCGVIIYVNLTASADNPNAADEFLITSTNPSLIATIVQAATDKIKSMTNKIGGATPNL